MTEPAAGSRPSAGGWLPGRVSQISCRITAVVLRADWLQRAAAVSGRLGGRDVLARMAEPA